MGLDQFAYEAKKSKALSNFNCPKKFIVNFDFDYWRKFYGLQNWMENLYREKGGTEKVFNCIPLRLTEQDLERLDRDSDSDEFYEDRYFQTLEEEKEHEVEHLKDFIKNAKQAITEGYVVYYDSWW